MLATNLQATATATDDGRRFGLTWPASLLLWCYGLTLLLTASLNGRVLTYHEVVFAQPAREMLATGDWLVPRIAGVPFLDKPPLTAWLIAGSMALFDSRAEWVVRLPSILCAVLTAWLIGLTAGRWLGARVGLVAGLMQVSSYYVLQMATLSEADMPLIAWVASAYCVFAWAQIAGPGGLLRGRWLPALYFLFVGLAFLTKGPVGPFFILSGCGLYVLLHRQWSAWRFFLDPLGWVILLVCVIPYPVFVYRAHPPIFDAWVQHNLGRMRGELGGEKFPFFYAVMVPVVLLPWLPCAGYALVRARRQLLHPLLRLLLCWFVPGMVLLGLSSFKSKHYPYPLLPGFTMLAAWGLVGLLEQAAWLRCRGLLGAAASCLVGAVVTALLPVPPFAIAGILGVLAGGLAVLAYYRQRQLLDAQLAALFGATWVVIVVVYFTIMPAHDSYRSQSELAQRINAHYDSSSPLYLVGSPDNQIVYYLAVPVTRVDDATSFLAQQRQVAGACQFIAPQWLVEAVSQEGHEVRILDQCATLLRWMKPGDRMLLAQRLGPQGKRPR